MKRIIGYIAAAAALLLAFIGCRKHEKPLDITGEWNLSRIETKSATIGGQAVDVYISFTPDNKFQMYQMLGTGRYRSFSGTWSLVEKTLSGKYNDGSAWAASYEVAVDGGTMTLSTASETDTYVKKNIPESVISSAE